ncbi:MAG: hypothetical protein LBD77_00060 [Bifidobacteriaceae bacterium]|jgi:hypothetical protein|nr:hypothetical protein [Bifidobacteriaceae bacterium]
MPKGSRRARRRAAPRRPLDLARARGGAPARASLPDGREFFVSPPSPSPKAYVCPGCGAPVAPGQVQVTVWEADSLLGADAALELRRHWHLACWRAFAV